MKEWVTHKELYIAYLECRRNKRGSLSCEEFEQDEAANIDALWYELNSMKYEIGISIAFIIINSKAREVFAADFRDRVVHHFLIRRIGEILKSHFIQDTYSCIKGRGNLYGIKRLYKNMQEFPDYYNVRLDIQGFFYCINKNILWKMLEKVLKEEYKQNDLEQVLWLTQLIVMHKPQYNCKKHGNEKLWLLLDPTRSLFTCGDDFGLAIGNLTSQYFANFYLSGYDWHMYYLYKELFRRYVDDTDTLCKKEEIGKVITEQRNYLKNELGATLHPKKVFIQPVKHGILFIGQYIKKDRIYTNNETVNNAFGLVKEYNKLVDEPDIEEWVERFAQRMNSYLGFLKYTHSYAIRWNLWNFIDKKFKKYFYMTDRMSIVKVKKDYKLRNRLKQKYGKKRIRKR